MRLARQLGARRFESQCMEMRARMLLDTGRRAEAAAMLREAVAICREVGMQFSGPKALGALSRAVAEPAERDRLLAEGEELLRRGAVGHNHLWFYRDAIEAHAGGRRCGRRAALRRRARELHASSLCPGRTSLLREAGPWRCAARPRSRRDEA